MLFSWFDCLWVRPWGSLTKPQRYQEERLTAVEPEKVVTHDCYHIPAPTQPAKSRIFEIMMNQGDFTKPRARLAPLSLRGNRAEPERRGDAPQANGATHRSFCLWPSLSG